ncbi:MAG: YceI family protein [Saprospiraceae bacterium]|nr:YceI family protein [Saprospiraceae bacterium]
MRTYLIALLVLFGFSSVSAQKSWSIDKAHSKIGFTVTHMTIAEVDGQFTDYEASISSKSDDFANSDVSFSAKAGSIETGNDRRDGHLKSDDFFSAETYPEIKFEGKIIKEGDDYFLEGDLTIKETTKRIKWAVDYRGQVSGQKGAKAGFKIEGSIDRFDYDVKWDKTLDTGGLVVGEEVQIICKIELNEVQA